MFTRTADHRVGRACLRRVVCGLRSGFGPLRSIARRLAGPLRDERGTAVMEFGLLAPPFFLLLVGTLEVSVMFFTDTIIEGATKEAARQIRTGQIQVTANPVASFQTKLCASLYNVIDCSKVIFNVQTFSSFDAVSMPIEVDEDGEIVNTGFVPGGSGAVTVVRAMYRWHFMTPLIGNVLPETLGGRLLVSTVAFQNEPYNVD